MKKEENKEHTTDHYIVAIGASAGGLEAIHEFFDNMPSSDHLSFIIIQHLSPDYKSLLVELVSKHTRMQVLEAEQGMQVIPNCVYIIPNNKLLTIRDKVLQLQTKIADRLPNTAIDIFMKSLAKDQGSRAIGIILSGTGTDGSKGIVELSKQEGFVIVQDPSTAKFDGMPNSAIATGSADLILSPELMPEELFNYIQEKPVRISLDGRPDEEDLPEVLQLIEKNCQLDFQNYKTPTILRRITRRMGLLGFKEFKDYLSLLKNSPNECGFLGKEFLIGVTKFFRDDPAFKLLRSEVLVPLIKSKNNNDILKVWIVACSTGEEAYSTAILIDQILEELDKNLEVKIFASDIDGESIEFASRGSYFPASLNNVDPEIRTKYFTEENNRFVVNARIRKQIVFAKHNVLKDPPFIKNDLVSCRNMLIYMNSILQRKVVATLQFSLNIEGYLFLGPSESPLEEKDGFREINGKWKLYQKTASGVRYSPERYMGNPTLFKVKKTADPAVRVPADPVARDLSEDFKHALTEKFSFAGIYIDKNFEIKEGIGDFRKYLELPEKLNSMNIMRMVPKEISIVLNTAVRRSIKEGKEVELNNLKLLGDENKTVTIYVRPSNKHEYTMIVFAENLSTVHSHNSTSHHETNGDISANYVADLEDELKETRINLQMAVESLETANEELQSSNEELLSANEELQSSNEELQSLNEELHTLNTEHQLRIRELVELNDDLNNYFSTTEVAQVFIDADFRIRKFNPVAVKLINLIESDIGRPISHISTNIMHSKNFLDDIQKVVETGVTIEKEVQLINGSTSLMKILPYVRQDKRTDGATVTFVDISYVKELNNIIHSVFNSTTSSLMAFRAVRNKRDYITDFEWIAGNHAADSLLRKEHNEYIGNTLKEVFPQLLEDGREERIIRVVEDGRPFHTETQLTLEENSGWYSMVVTPMMDGVVINLTNIDDKKKSEEKLRKNYHELIKSKEAFRTLNTELEQKIRERTFELSQSEERFRLVSRATSDAIWDRDLVNDNIWWSDSFYHFFGYEPSEETSKVSFYMNQVHPDDKQKVEEALHEAINQTRSWKMYYRIRKQDGEYVYVMDSGVVLVDENDIPYRLLGAITDRSSEEIARQNEALKISNVELEELVQQRTRDVEAQKNILQRLFMMAPAIICTFKGPDHVYDLVNPVAKRLLGNREVVGLSVAEVMGSHFKPERRAILDKVYQTGETYIGQEEKINLNNGVDPETEIYLNLLYQATRDANDEIDGILVFAYDVTEQVLARQALIQANEELGKANQEFQFVSDFMPQMVWVTLPNGDHIFYNKGWYEYTGLNFEETGGEGWNHVLHPDDRERAWKVWKNSLHNGSDYEIEYRIRRFDGEYRWFLGRALPMKDDEGNVIKWFGTCTDIHDQKIASDTLEAKVKERTEELQKINLELESSNHELLQFASIASHDLKEPLRKIIMFSNMVRDRHLNELPAGALEYITKIIASSTRMNALVADLLSFTKLSVDSEFEKADLKVILNEVLSDLELVIKEKAAIITTPDMPEAEIVPGQMRQVFQNIISNSLKFTRNGVTPEITITCQLVNRLSFIDALDENGKFIRISIQDNGIGFENLHSEKIFTIFQRLHTKNKFEGTGIGLAIAKKIIAKHHGIIKGTGVEGEGACFVIVIPLKQESVRQEHKQVAALN